MAVLRMPLALAITISTLLVVIFFTVAYERDICIAMLDWLQQSDSKRVKLSPPAFSRLMDGPQKAVKSR